MATIPLRPPTQTDPRRQQHHGSLETQAGHADHPRGLFSFLPAPLRFTSPLLPPHATAAMRYVPFNIHFNYPRVLHLPSAMIVHCHDLKHSYPRDADPGPSRLRAKRRALYAHKDLIVFQRARRGKVHGRLTPHTMAVGRPRKFHRSFCMILTATINCGPVSAIERSGGYRSHKLAT